MALTQEAIDAGFWRSDSVWVLMVQNKHGAIVPEQMWWRDSTTNITYSSFEAVAMRVDAINRHIASGVRLAKPAFAVRIKLKKGI